MKKYFEILCSCKLFEGIAKENIMSMLGCLNATVRHFEKNETVIMEGSSAKNICILLSGNVRIEQTDYYGNRSIVASVSSGELFGESFACAGVDSIPVSVVATEASEVMSIDCRRVTQSCSNACSFHQRIIYNLLKIAAQKNLMFHQKLQITSKRTTREKLMTYLLQQAKKLNSDRFSIPFDRQQLADYLEVDRSGLSAEISKLRKEGVLKCRKNRFELLKEI